MALLRMYPKTIALALVVCGFVSTASAGLVGLDYSESQLALKDYESMQALVQKIRNRNLHMDDQDETRRINMKDAVVVLFSRRDNDGTRSKLYRILQSDLDEDSVDILDVVVDESIEGAKDAGLSVEERSTRLLILQNLLNELRNQQAAYKPLFEKIKNANLKITDDVYQFRRLRGMAKAESPSDIAKVILTAKK